MVGELRRQRPARSREVDVHRKLLATAAAVAMAAAGVVGSTASAEGHHHGHGHQGQEGLPGGYKHLVVIYEENHSFDNLYGGCTRDLVHRFYQEQYQLDHGKQDRYISGSDAVGLTMGYYDTKQLPIY